MWCNSASYSLIQLLRIFTKTNLLPPYYLDYLPSPWRMVASLKVLSYLFVYRQRRNSVKGLSTIGLAINTHWPFSDQFQHLANQNLFWLAKFTVHFNGKTITYKMSYLQRKWPTNLSPLFVPLIWTLVMLLTV